MPRVTIEFIPKIDQFRDKSVLYPAQVLAV